MAAYTLARMLPLLAAVEKVKPLEKLQGVSGQFWLKVILAFILLAVAISVIKKAMGVNRIFMVIICMVVCGLCGVYWTYERTEPAFLTPIIEPIARSGFLPQKDFYENKQQQDPTTKDGKKPAPAKPAK